jgi:hypothetical protein
LIGVLEWDISSTRSDNTFAKLFDFEWFLGWFLFKI